MELSNLKAIETGIVLAGTLLLFSLMVTATNEFVGRLINLRGRILRMFFLRFLGSELAQTLEQNVWITFHKKQSWTERNLGLHRRPKKISPTDFARAILMDCTQESMHTLIHWCNANQLLLPPTLFQMKFKIFWSNDLKVSELVKKWSTNNSDDLPFRERLAEIYSYPNLALLNELDAWIKANATEDQIQWKEILEASTLHSGASAEFKDTYNKYRMAEGISQPVLSEKLFNSGKLFISGLPEPAKSYFQTLYQEAQGDAQVFQKKLETWYEESLNKISLWYQDRMVLISIVIGFLLAFAMNISPIILTEELWKNDKMRTQMADYYSQDSVQFKMKKMLTTMERNSELKKEIHLLEVQNKESNDSILTVLNQKKLDSLNTLFMNQSLLVMNEATHTLKSLEAETELPIGWKGKDFSKLSLIEILKMFFGYTLMGIFCSWGAPFWYELLARLISTRKLIKGNSQ